MSQEECDRIDSQYESMNKEDRDRILRRYGLERRADILSMYGKAEVVRVYNASREKAQNRTSQHATTRKDEGERMTQNEHNKCPKVINLKYIHH